ncbi:MAG: HAMP domain-containing sensor histidine kinase [Cyanobacteria bacterium P01_D01_bin.105]
MGVSEQLLPTISALVALGEFSQDDVLSVADSQTVLDTLPAADKQKRAESEWQGAISALHQLLRQEITTAGLTKKTSKRSRQKSIQALVLTGPVPLFNDTQSDAALTANISNWTLVPQSSDQLASSFRALSPVERIFGKRKRKQCQKDTFNTRLLPLLEEDPLIKEQFAVAFTSHFALVLVLGKDADGELRFQFSFMPQVVSSVWRMLRSRIRVIRPRQLEFIDPLVEKFNPQEPHYRTVSQFNRWMLAYLPQSETSLSRSSSSTGQGRNQSKRVAHNRADHSRIDHSQTHQPSTVAESAPSQEQFSDSALLKAMAHEIRTPLTTIRTYTRSLLKRKTLDPQVIKRLQSIDRECTQQIDRFSLIFRAVELEAASQTPKSPLSAIALHQVFQEAIPQWQQAALRRNLSLEVGLPDELPMVASDPTMLQHVLTGLVELFTHSVAPGGHIQLHVLHAGDQLKLQFQSQGNPQAPSQQQSQAISDFTNPNYDSSCTAPPLQSLGHLLMFQPETGGLSLNLEATKNLFHALGAKLTVRDRPNQGTTWTVFLPLEASGLKSYPIV